MLRRDLRDAGWVVLLWSLGLGIAAIVYLVAGWRVYVASLMGSLLGVSLFMLDPVRVLVLLDEWTRWEP